VSIESAERKGELLRRRDRSADSLRPSATSRGVFLRKTPSGRSSAFEVAMTRATQRVGPVFLFVALRFRVRRTTELPQETSRAGLNGIRAAARLSSARGRVLLDEIFLPSGKLLELARGRAPDYAAAEPFPHAVLEDLFPPAVLEKVLEEFPRPDSIDWIRYDDRNQVKLASRRDEQLGPVTRAFIHFLNSSVFVEFLEELTGIAGLVPDPHLEGGGLHQIVPGGMLAIHADFNRSTRLKLDRRLNLLLYLNRDWSEEWGGHLELWDRAMSARVKRIAPVYNRTVVFSTTDFAFHGHPEPLRCPEGRSRKSIALYYYSNGRPPEEVSGGHSTLFQTSSDRAKEVVKKLVPPIVLDLRRKLRGDA
jgi:Rps23 Pro-64 3,4-dihydroxylase Tpa1-like proline 4-hydroxylase